MRWKKCLNGLCKCKKEHSLVGVFFLCLARQLVIKGYLHKNVGLIYMKWRDIYTNLIFIYTKSTDIYTNLGYIYTKLKDIYKKHNNRPQDMSRNLILHIKTPTISQPLAAYSYTEGPYLFPLLHIQVD
jgi:hypothetical protein